MEGYSVETAMAIFDWTLQTISRSAGRSAVAAAAYRAGAYLRDDRTGLAHDFSRRRGIQTKIVLPSGVSMPVRKAPTWSQELRSRLWNEAERTERRCNSVVAREIVLALPHELDEARRAALGCGYAQWIAERYRVAVDVAWHPPSASGDQRNHHLHMQFTTREVSDGFGFGPKTRILDAAMTGGPEIAVMRSEWAAMTNASLEAAGREERVDHRSLADRGVDREPSQHLGPMRTNMIRACTRRVAALDAEIAELQAEIAILEAREQREQERLHPPPLTMVIIDQRTIGPLGPYRARGPSISSASPLMTAKQVATAPVSPSAIVDKPQVRSDETAMGLPALAPAATNVASSRTLTKDAPALRAQPPMPAQPVSAASSKVLEDAVRDATMAEVDRQNHAHAAMAMAQKRAADEAFEAKKAKRLRLSSPSPFPLPAAARPFTTPEKAKKRKVVSDLPPLKLPSGIVEEEEDGVPKRRPKGKLLVPLGRTKGMARAIGMATTKSRSRSGRSGRER